MSKETILVSYAESLVGQPWLEEAIAQSISPHLETSILLTDTHDVHPLLAEKWKGQRVVQYRPNGQRCVDGQIQHEWMTKIEKIAGTQDFRKLHAFALRLALLSAFRQGYDVRSFLFLPHEPIEGRSEICEILLANGSALPGTTTFFEQGNPSVTHSEMPLILWIDTETTGLAWAKHAVIEIAATLTDARSEHVIDRFDSRCAVPSWVTAEPGALDVNKYYTDPRWESKTDHETMVRSFAQWMPKQCRLGGHNVTFDRSFLEASLRHYGLAIPAWNGPTQDTMPMADRILKRTGKIENRKLETVCRYFGLDTKQLHGARVDIDKTLQVYHLLNALLRQAA